MLLSDDRRGSFLPLAETGMPSEALGRLAAMGITTVEELRDTWTYGNHQLLTDFLGESPVRFTMVRPSSTLTRSSAASGPGESVNLLAGGPVRPIVRHARGLVVPASQLGRRADAPDPVAFGGRLGGGTRPSGGLVSLIDRLPAVRDQGQRGTCVAFATVACLEFRLAGSLAKTRRRSEQFLYWACKESDGIPNQEGTHLSVARKVLKARGACLHSTWKYEPMPIGPGEGQGPPPPGAESEAKQARWPDTTAISVDALRGQLDQGRPVVLGVKTFPNWDFPTVSDTGEITMPLPNSLSDGGHAVCLVGYELRPGVPGGGVFIFRNSWGKKWAGSSRFRAGYGTIFFEYARKYLVDAFS